MIFQTADNVVIFTEQARQARVIPLDNTEKPQFEQLAGVSRGHWEGETLVIETTQFRDWGTGGPARTCTWSNGSPGLIPIPLPTSTP